MVSARGAREWLVRTPCVAATGIIGTLLLLLGAGLGWAYLPAVIDTSVVERVVLVDDSPAFERWRRLPQPLITKFYLFNVTNPEEVQNGARPVLQEVGPYVYDQYLEKVDIEKHEDSENISYYLNTTFFFNQELSGNLSPSDNVTIINLPLLGTVLKVKKQFPFVLKLVDPILEEIFLASGSVFLSGAVGQLLFEGVAVVNCSNSTTETAIMVCDQLDSQMPDTVQRTGDLFKFAFYRHKNGTSKERFTVDRGLADPRRLAKVVALDGSDSVAAWDDPRCDLINGTDGIFFPPLRTAADPLVAFSLDICRTVTLQFERKAQYKGLPVLRYVNDPAMLGDADTYPDNRCYCPGRSSHRTCLKAGVMDLLPCTGVSIILSYPHLYMADEEYLNYAEGLSPAKRKHETFVDVEPRTGLPLRGSKKAQLNMFLTRIPEVSVLRNVSEGLFPAIWIEEGVEVNDKNMVLLHSLNNMVNTFFTARWMAVIIGVALCVAASMAFYTRRKNCGSYDNRVTPFKEQGAHNMGFVHDDTSKPVSPPDVTRTGLPYPVVVADRKCSSGSTGDLRRKGSSSAAEDAKNNGPPFTAVNSGKDEQRAREDAKSPSSAIREDGAPRINPLGSKADTSFSSWNNSEGSNGISTPPAPASVNGVISPSGTTHVSEAASSHPAADSNSTDSSVDDNKSTTSVRSIDEVKGAGSRADLNAPITGGHTR